MNVAKHWHVAGRGICHLWLPCFTMVCYVKWYLPKSWYQKEIYMSVCQCLVIIHQQQKTRFLHVHLPFRKHVCSFQKRPGDQYQCNERDKDSDYFQCPVAKRILTIWSSFCLKSSNYHRLNSNDTHVKWTNKIRLAKIRMDLNSVPCFHGNEYPIIVKHKCFSKLIKLTMTHDIIEYMSRLGNGPQFRRRTSATGGLFPLSVSGVCG